MASEVDFIKYLPNVLQMRTAEYIVDIVKSDLEEVMENSLLIWHLTHCNYLLK